TARQAIDIDDVPVADVGQAAGRRIVRPTIAVDRIVGGIANIGIVNAELRMVEDVEGFDAKLQIGTLGNLEILLQGHIEVQAVRFREEISSWVAEGQPAGSRKSRGAVKQWADALRWVEGRPRTARTAHDIGVGSGSGSIRHAGIVQNRDTAVAAA